MIPQVKSQADYLLFDAPIAGSGQTFDWQLLADKQIGAGLFHRWWLNWDNVAEAKETFPALCLRCVPQVSRQMVAKDLDKD